MTPTLPISETCDSLDTLRLRMIRELEWFLSSAVLRTSARLIPTTTRSHDRRPQTWYDTRATRADSAAGEKSSC